MSQTDDVLAPENPADENYYFVLTDAGAALEAAAHAKGKPLRLTHMAVGDGDGEVPHPAQNATALVNEVYRREIDGSRVDEDDPNICWLNMLIPATVGGFWIREFGVYAEPLEEGGEPVLYAYGNHTPYYKTEKVLGQATTHEVQVPVIISGSANVQIAIKDAGYASQSSLNVTNQTVGQQGQKLTDHDAEIAALKAYDQIVAEAIKAATNTKLGLIKPDNVTIEVDANGTLRVNVGRIYELCEFYYFRNPKLRQGFEELNGCIIEGAADMYPEAWAFLQSEEGQAICLTETAWQELSAKSYYTLADGTQIGFNGIGGVPFYSLNTSTGALRMPDIRGMYPEAAGFDSLNVGGAGIDRARNITGRAPYISTWTDTDAASGAFYWSQHRPRASTTSNANSYDALWLDSWRVVPTGAANAPRHFGVLACAWLGKPSA